MSELLLHWINNDLQLSSYVTNVESDFSSGYLLGEILHRLNQQHNFTDFMDSAIADAKIINFCLLEPTFRHLNIKFDSKIATSIMNGKSGAAANVLYQIKMASDRIARAPGVSTKSVERTNIRPLHNMPVKLAKPTYDAAHHYFFEHSVRRQVKSLGALRQEKEAIEVDKRRMVEYRVKQAHLKEELELTKAERLHQAFIHSEFIKTALEETDSPAWRLALQKKSEREHRKAAFYQQLIAEKARKEQLHTFSLRHTVENDLDEFERRGPSSKSTTSANGSGQPSRKSIGYGLRSLSTTLENQHARDGPGLTDPQKPVPVSDTNAQLVTSAASIRDQKQHRERRREQFERRRKRFLQDSLHHQSLSNNLNTTQDLEDLIQRSSHREAESRQAMAKILIYKEIATDNRARREESYTNRREIDSHEAIDRDSASFVLLFAKYNDDWEIQSMQKAHRLMARFAAQQHENRLVVGLVMHELVEFALFVAGKREDSTFSRDDASFLSTSEAWEEHKFTFATRGPLALAGSGEDNSQGMEGEEELVYYQLKEYLQRFLTPAFTNHDYVGAVAKGTALSPWVPSGWKFIAAVEILEDQYVLGETVKYLRWLTHGDPPSVSQTTPRIESLPSKEETPSTLLIDATPPEAVEGNCEITAGEAVIESLQASESAPEVEEAPQELVVSTAPVDGAHPSLPRLCILLFGPPFAGKATQAKQLADKYELSVLSVEQLLMDAIESQTSLGSEAQTLLASGQEIPPRIYSALVHEAVQKLTEAKRNRWILFDLPSTAAHAQSLEEHLTEFVDPTRVKSPYDYETLLALGCSKPRLPKSFLFGRSGVDLVFYLDCADSTVLERCLGKLEDCETKEQRHHLLFSPPELDATDRHRLQHVNSTSNASALLSLQSLSTLDFVEPHNQWFKQFDTLRKLATTESSEGQRVAITRALTIEETHRRLVELVEAFFDQQQAARQAQQQEKELAENVAMEREENRQLKLAELKRGLLLAQEEVTKAQHVVQQAEEAKAKKEEIAELRNGIENAKKLVESALVDARDWLFEESLQVRHAHSTFSGSLHPPLARVLAGVWDAMEAEYVHVMKQCMKLQRQQRGRVETRVQWIIETVTRFVRRADKKQLVVNAFQSQFNAVIEEMRFEDATKQELHARTDVLQDELCLIVTAKQRESEDELREIMADGWLEDTCQWIAVIFQRALQAECDRFRVSVQLLLDAFQAASDEPAQLAGVGDHLKANPQLMAELTLKTFVDEEQVVPVVAAAPTPAAAPAPAAKGAKGAAAAKAKPPLVSTPSVHAGAVMAEAVDPLSLEALLQSYDSVVQRCETLVQAIVNAPPKQAEAAKPPEPVAPAAPAAVHAKTGGKTGNTPAATPTATPVSSVALLPRQSIDIATSNFIKAVKYEQELLLRRVRYLKDSVQSACDHVGRGLRSVETTLQAMIEQRAKREEAAVASLVNHVRATIEAEIDLPSYIDVKPPQVYRFPSLQHLIEDTRVTVDSRLRLVPRAPVDPPPEIEVRHSVLLNERQQNELRARLGVRLGDKGTSAPQKTLVEVVRVLHGLTTVPFALPEEWQSCTEEALAKLVAPFAEEDSGLVDLHALLHTLATDEQHLSASIKQPAVAPADVHEESHNDHHVDT